MTTDQPFIHPATPKKLARIHKKNGYKYHKTAEDEKIGVNVRFVYDLIHDGKEPTDRTAHGRNIRKKLGLPKKKPGNKSTKPEKPFDYLTCWWRVIGKERRRNCLTHCFLRFSTLEDAAKVYKYDKANQSPKTGNQGA